MMKPDLDEIAQALFARVIEWEIEKAAYRQRYRELELKARQNRNTKEAAQEAAQARQARKHPDQKTTSISAAKRAAERRLQKARDKALIATVDDWKCRLIAEIAAEEVAVFAEIEADSRGGVDAATPTPGANRKARSRKSKAKISLPETVLPEPEAGAATPETQPAKIADAGDLTFEENRSEAPLNANQKRTDSGSDVWPHSQSNSSERGSIEQEILPPLSERNEQSDIEQEDLF